MVITSASSIPKFPWKNFDWKPGAGLFSPSIRIIPPTDHLSISPSIVAILSYVDIDDVDECKLVSRFFYDVIRRNMALMRREIDIRLDNETDDDGNLTSVQVAVTTYAGINTRRKRVQRRMFIYLEEGRIRMEKCIFRGFFNSYKKAIDKKEIQGIRHGLEIVLVPLFHRFDVCFFETFEDTSRRVRTWQKRVTRLFKESQCKCRCVAMPTHPKLEYLIEALGCEVAIVDLEGLHGRLPQYLRGGLRELAVYVQPGEETKTIKLISEYIQAWLSGQLLVKKLRIHNEEGHPQQDTRKIHQGVVSALRYGTVYCTSGAYFRGNAYFCFFLQRPTDDMVLAIDYVDIVRIHHFAYYGKLENITSLCIVRELRNHRSRPLLQLNPTG